MNTQISRHERYHHVALESAPQILHCSYCVLLEWSHDDFSAPYWRWYWNDRPGAILLLEHESLPIGPGEVLLVPPHTVAGTALKGKVGHLFMHFALGLDRAVAPGKVFRHRPSARERAMISRLVRAAEAPAEERPLETTFLANALINSALTSVPADYWAGRLLDARIARALRSLTQGSEPADNTRLAREAGMHPDAFVRKFVQATGHTPQRFGLRLRVERAAARLLEGGASIEQIAAEAGFCDRFHFSRAFKQVMGASPARYRREREQRRV